MLTAHSGMSAREFVSQLRTYVIALGLGPTVVDQVDNLVGRDDLEDEHAASETKIEEEAEARGRQSMKDEITAVLTEWLEKQPNYDLIVAPCEAMLKCVDEVEV